MEDEGVIRDIANSDALSLLVGTWIALGGENDGDSEPRFRFDRD